MFRILIILVTVLITSAVSAALLKPQVPPEARAIYMDMLQTNPTAAKAYLITREYLRCVVRWSRIQSSRAIFPIKLMESITNT
jgi:hypothetical protein